MSISENKIKKYVNEYYINFPMPNVNDKINFMQNMFFVFFCFRKNACNSIFFQKKPGSRVRIIKKLFTVFKYRLSNIATTTMIYNA